MWNVFHNANKATSYRTGNSKLKIRNISRPHHRIWCMGWWIDANTSNVGSFQASLLCMSVCVCVCVCIVIRYEEKGKMAPQLMYVHVLLPLNITSPPQQAEVFKAYLINISNTKTSNCQSSSTSLRCNFRSKQP